MENEKVYDVTIIGGGPIGMFTAFYAGLRQMSCKIIESLPQLGGQLSALYPEKFIYDVAGFAKVSGQELVNRLQEQMNQFETTVCLEETVIDVKKTDNGVFKLMTNTTTHYTKTIIITAGNGAFKPKKLELDGTDKYEKENLHYFIRDINHFKEKKVQIFGGGDSAVDWALMLEPIAEKVTIAHRRNQFRAHEHSIELMKKSSIDIKTPYVPAALVGEGKIEYVVLQEVDSNHIEEIEVDDVIVTYGFVSSLGPIENWGLQIEEESIEVNSKMETNIPGIYAAGDICTYEGKVKLIASGFGEAPTAISNAKVYIDPKSRVQPKHSTSMF